MDDFKLVTLKGITGGFKVAKTAISILLNEIIPKNKMLCEPHMGKYNLYPALSTKSIKSETQHYMDFLQYADGKNTLRRISNYIKVSLPKTTQIYKLLKNKNLIE